MADLLFLCVFDCGFCASRYRTTAITARIPLGYCYGQVQPLQISIKLIAIRIVVNSPDRSMLNINYADVFWYLVFRIQRINPGHESPSFDNKVNILITSRI